MGRVMHTLELTALCIRTCICLLPPSVVAIRDWRMAHLWDPMPLCSIMHIVPIPMLPVGKARARENIGATHLKEHLEITQQCVLNGAIGVLTCAYRCAALL